MVNLWIILLCPFVGLLVGILVLISYLWWTLEPDEFLAIVVPT